MGPQGLRDWSAAAGKTSQTGGGQCNGWYLIPSLGVLWDLQGERGMGGGWWQKWGLCDTLAKTVVRAAAAELITAQNLDSHKRPDCQREIQSARVCSLSEAPIQDINVHTSILRDCASYPGCRGHSGQRVKKEVRKSIIPTTRCFSWGGRVGRVTPMPVFFGIWVDTCQYLLWIEVCMKVILMSRNRDLILQIWAMSHIFRFINHTKSTFMSQATRSVRRWHPSSVIFVASLLCLGLHQSMGGVHSGGECR